MIEINLVPASVSGEARGRYPSCAAPQRCVTLSVAVPTMDASLVGSALNRSTIQSTLKDRSYVFTKRFRRPRPKNPTVTKNDEPFFTINVMYSVVLGKKPTYPFIS
ncbi:hypothetical protein P3C24_07375 [Pseudomonas proteolytica]|uniref:hypothetical protein n=1 Tax=Pseudomonas proteolytica TaxID=219574 RepID=UPI0023DF3EDC|nr:hypothetical protein [Pseudomonas proteolytica]MDF3160783.1 hypothetical protein [Pseudomonas proteolytica]